MTTQFLLHGPETSTVLAHHDRLVRTRTPADEGEVLLVREGWRP
jgi:hypothetical protein